MKYFGKMIEAVLWIAVICVLLGYLDINITNAHFEIRFGDSHASTK